MSLRRDWLQQMTTVAEVEAGFAQEPPVDPWPQRWRALVAAMQPGDELWEFRSPPETWRGFAGRAGYVILRQGEAVDGILTEMS